MIAAPEKNQNQLGFGKIFSCSFQAQTLDQELLSMQMPWRVGVPLVADRILSLGLIGI